MTQSDNACGRQYEVYRGDRLLATYDDRERAEGLAVGLFNDRHWSCHVEAVGTPEGMSKLEDFM